MKLSAFTKQLESLEKLGFKHEHGNLVPSHFHITEVGQTNKHFIDCGGVVRNETKVSFQLYTAEDYDHRLAIPKLKAIIEKSKNALSLEDAEIEVEHQTTDTIGKYALGFDGEHFTLIPTVTDCLAKDNCGIPTKEKKTIQEVAACTPGSGCCN